MRFAYLVFQCDLFVKGNISFAIPTCFCNCSVNPYYKVKLCFEHLGKNQLTSKLLKKNLLNQRIKKLWYIKLH